jgi:glyoxylase-like metal-dependent hydrolase (beta-lactamase superfamily II)
MNIKPMAAGLALFGAIVTPSTMADDHNKIQSHAVNEYIHVISGDGGNITVVQDERGLLVVDSGLRPYSEDLLMTISDIADAPVKYLVNTHWHFDHVGANAAMNDMAATIFAHHNVHQRMVSGGKIAAFGRDVAPAEPQELPVVTYDDGLRFHWGNDVLDVVHFPAGHTDGDSVVFVEGANTVIMGDIFFHSMYPFIDASSGGSLQGVINAVSDVLAKINDDTVVIPGHGGITTNKAELTAYRDMLQSMYTTLAAMKKAGKSAEEAVAAKPTAAFDAEWNDGFLKADTWVKVVYDAI